MLEHLRRDNLFRPVRGGSSGLIHLYVGQLVGQFTFFRAGENPFFRTFLEVYLTAHLPNVMVCSAYDEVLEFGGF